MTDTDSFTIVHISDLHYCPLKHPNTDEVIASFHTDLSQIIKGNRLEPDLLVFTGDLVEGEIDDPQSDDYVSQQDQFDSAHDLLIRPIQESYANLKDRTRTIIVPGNHDVCRTLSTKEVRTQFYEIGEVKGGGGLRKLAGHMKGDTPLFQKITTHLDPYRAFLRTHNYDHLLQDQSRLYGFHCIKLAGIDVGIFLLNSAWGCHKATGKRGQVFAAMNTQITKLIREHKNKAHLNIACMHHPGNWMRDEMTEVAGSLAKHFDIILEGHEHRTYHTSLNKSCDNFNSGALSNGENRRTGYRIIQVFPKESYIRAWQRTYEFRDGAGWTEDHQKGKTNSLGMFPVSPRYDLPRASRKEMPKATGSINYGLLGKELVYADLPLPGCLFICFDLPFFSTLPASDKLDAVELFWDALTESKSEFGINDEGFRILPRSEGAIVVIHSNVKPTGDKIYRFIQNIQRKMNSEKYRYRVSLHSGSAFLVSSPKSRNYNFAGRGINDVVRLCNYGDPGQMIISDDFFIAVQEYPESMSFEVVGDKKIPTYYTVMGGPRKELSAMWAPIDPSIQKTTICPRRFQTIKFIESKIQEHLYILVNAIDESVKKYAKVNPSDSKVRLSILHPVNMGDGLYLTATQFRVASQEDVPLGKGLSKYSIDGTGIGFPAKSYISRKPTWKFGLPDPFDERGSDPPAPSEEYLDALSEFDLEQHHVSKWQRFSQCFIDIPLAVDKQFDGYPDGVLCIDFLNPLERLAVNSKSAEKLVDDIYKEVSDSISVFWKLYLTS